MGGSKCSVFSVCVFFVLFCFVLFLCSSVLADGLLGHGNHSVAIPLSVCGACECVCVCVCVCVGGVAPYM